MASPLYTSTPVAKWRAARRLYPIYCGLASHFALDSPPFAHLEETEVQGDPDFLARVEAWFATIDSRLHVAQFRQIVESTTLAASEDKLHALIERHLTKPEKNDNDRDKLDFLLVQYFAVCAPPTLPDGDLRLEEAAEVLAPVLGQVTLDLPEWLRPLESWTPALAKVTELRELQASAIGQQARRLKAAAKQLYFAPISLVAFTRFSYLLRRAYLRLIGVELKAIDAALEKLAGHGEAVIDCSAAQMSPDMPVGDLRRFCQNYKKPALPEYSVDSSILRLIQLRQIVDASLAQIESPDDPILAEIEERCRRVEGELVALRKLAAGLAANRHGAISTRATQAADRAMSEFEHVLDLSFDIPGAEPEPVPELQASEAVAVRKRGRKAEPPATHDFPEPEVVVEAAPVPAPEPEPEPARAVPEITVETAPESQPAPVPDIPEPSLTDAMEEIRKKLAAAPRKGISSLNIAGTALLLTPDEVEAFLRPRDESSIDLQRSLAARALLLQAVEMQKKSGSPEMLGRTVQLCRTEAASIQQHSSEAKQSNNSTAAAILNASASQLLSLIRQVERISRAS